MSWRHIEAVAEIELRAAVKSVLMAIAHHTNDHSGIAWPGLERLGRFTGLDRRSIQRCIKELEAHGLLTVKRGTGTSVSVYTLTLPDTPAIDVTDQKHLPPEALGPGGGTESPLPSGGGRESPQGRHRVASGAAESHPNKNERERKDASDARAFDDDWKPSAATVERIRKDEGIDDAVIERERKSFILNCLAGEIPRKPDAAFRKWCSRLKQLKHPIAEPPPAAKAGPLPLAEQIANLTNLIALYEKMGRTSEIPELKAKLERLVDEARLQAA